MLRFPFFHSSYDEDLAQSDLLIQDARGRLAINASASQGAVAQSRITARQDVVGKKSTPASWK
jgi:hypothetical protein